MANPIIKILRGITPPPTLEAGRIAIDQAAKNLYVGIDDGNGGTINEIVGGSGTFATKAFVADAITTATGDLGTMSTQNADSVAITGGSLNNGVNALFINGAEISSSPIDNCAIGANIASSGKFTSLDVTVSDITMSGAGLIDMNSGRITNLSAPVNDNDSVRKTDLDTAISALGSVFHYVGDLSAFMSVINGPFELDNVDIDLTTGSYYRVDVAGTYNAQFGGADPSTPDPAVSFDLKVGDAIVKTSTGWQKLDNVDAVVSGTANEISVTGDENAGYTVAIDSVFSGRVTTAEGDIDDLENLTQNFGSVAAGSTEINGEIWGEGKLTLSGTGTLLDIGGDIVASGTVSGTNITDLEAKTQNIDLAGTTAGTTQINGNVSIGNASFPDFKILNGQVQLNVATNSATVRSFGTLDINAGGGLGGPGAWIGLKSSGHLVADGTDLEIQGFIIDGGVY
jgi:hypothetical protein